VDDSFRSCNIDNELNNDEFQFKEEGNFIFLLDQSVSMEKSLEFKRLIHFKIYKKYFKKIKSRFFSAFLIKIKQYSLINFYNLDTTLTKFANQL
jgi:hypothetical protein